MVDNFHYYNDFYIECFIYEMPNVVAKKAGLKKVAYSEYSHNVNVRNMYNVNVANKPKVTYELNKQKQMI